MGFQSSFLRWIKLFYNRVQSAVAVNGYVSPFFDLSRGVRQGCPLSPLLYVLVAEVLAVNIRSNPRITGPLLPGASVSLSPISQYADDTSLILSSDDAIKASLEMYALYERGSRSKLNFSKSKGLWLGSWVGRSDPPVPLDWSADKVKVLGVFIGAGNVEEANWRPRLDSIQSVLLSWRQRSLSLRGKALIINALALSKIWYVASLIHMPLWVLKELNSLVFDFFWRTKRELVARAVVVQPFLQGGFAVVDTKLKVWSLLAQWVKRQVSSTSPWTSLMAYWFSLHFNASALDVFSRPFSFNPRVLPPFYSSLLLAWRALDGSYSQSLSSLVYAASDPHMCSSVIWLTAKSGYLYLLSENSVTPHWVEKFRPTYGPLYWPTTWRQLHFFDLDRSVIDFSWKVSHGVIYTAQRLISFGLSVSPSCFCGPILESLDHLLFSCPLAQSVLAWYQSLLFAFSHMCPVVERRHVLFGFSPADLRTLPRVFVYVLHVCKFQIWLARNDYRFRSIQPGAVPVIESVKTRVKSHLNLFFKRFTSSRRRRYFARHWGATGVIASVVDDRLAFHFGPPV